VPLPSHFTVEDIKLLERMVEALAGPFAGIAGFTPEDAKRMDGLLSKVFNQAPLDVRATVAQIDPSKDVLVQPLPAPDYSSPPRDPSGGPRPGDAFLVEGRRAPLIVDQVVFDEAPQPDSVKMLIVTTADGQLWALFRRPDTEDGPPFPLFTGSPVTSHPDPNA
jgi:hypothetical protein